MKWIKAIEDTPTHYQKVFIKHVKNGGGGYAQWDGQRKVFLNNQLFGPQGGKPEDFEWLDESASLPSSSVTGDEEISGIKEYDDLVKQYKNNEITFNQFACRLWNKAHFIGHSEAISFHEWVECSDYCRDNTGMYQDPRHRNLFYTSDQLLSIYKQSKK